MHKFSFISISIFYFLLLCHSKLIFEDQFDTLNFKTWQHEITMSGAGNWEFEQYRNNRSNTFVKNSTLYIKPTYTVDTLGDKTLRTGIEKIWGSGPADYCTSNDFFGCERNAASGNYLNPIMSGRIRSVNSFSFQYGKMEIRAKLPKGDWLWPAIWLLPKYNEFGNWPASGEIDLVESRGNDASYSEGGNDCFASTLHFGPYWGMDPYKYAHKQYKHTESLGNDFHVYGLSWTKDRLYTYIDDESNIILDVDMSKISNWERGQFPKDMNNPWDGESLNAPFNREFYIIMNVAVGGTQGYFPEGVGGKPWSNTATNSVNQFWDARASWQNTWKDDDIAMQIDYVKVWDLDGKENTDFVQA